MKVGSITTFRCCCAPLVGLLKFKVMHNNSEENTKQQQLEKALNKLLDYDSIKNYRNNLTEMFFAYNQSDFSDCAQDRGHKTSTFVYLGEFLTELSEISKK